MPSSALAKINWRPEQAPAKSQDPRRLNGIIGKWLPDSDTQGALNRSLQHLLAVYSLESQSPKSFVDADLTSALLCRVQLVYSRTSPFFWGSTVAAAHWYFRCCRAAKGCVDHRSRLSHS